MYMYFFCVEVRQKVCVERKQKTNLRSAEKRDTICFLRDRKMHKVFAVLASGFLALKHENRILGHSCMWFLQVRLCAVWPLENWLGSSLNQIQGEGGLDHCPRILLLCFRVRTSGWPRGEERQRKEIERDWRGRSFANRSRWRFRRYSSSGK